MIEYEYEIEDILDHNGGLCFICDKKFTSTYGLGVCKKCFDALMITKTNSKKIYKLDNTYLDYLKSHKRKSPYHDCATYFLILNTIQK